MCLPMIAVAIGYLTNKMGKVAYAVEDPHKAESIVRNKTNWKENQLKLRPEENKKTSVVVASQ